MWKHDLYYNHLHIFEINSCYTKDSNYRLTDSGDFNSSFSFIMTTSTKLQAGKIELHCKQKQQPWRRVTRYIKSAVESDRIPPLESYVIVTPLSTIEYTSVASVFQ